ncbi:transposase [Gemmata massiliana]|uniref:transposase n=1 Tax=Gemmata massiliana TaxID=1210884 RepID=UPI0013A6F46D|nr:transposase [Gemmata massiliana]
MTADYANRRTLHTLTGVTRLNLTIRRCHNTACVAHKKPYRPEAEGSFALPRHEFGLDVVALIGRLRYAEHRSVPEIRAHLVGRKVTASERTVTNLLDRYDELLATSLTDDGRLKAVLAAQGKVILAIDGLQPDVGHEILWVIRDVLSGEILLAKSLLSARNQDLAELLSAVKTACGVPVTGVISDGQHSIRKAVAKALPGVPYQLCQFHFLREAAGAIYEADRHAKVALKKKVRGVRQIERKVEGRTDPEADVIRGYCSAVRSAITDDGRPPLEASGLKLHARLSAVVVSLSRVKGEGGAAPELTRLEGILCDAFRTAGGAFAPVYLAFGWVHQAAHILGRIELTGAAVRRRLSGLLGAMTRHRGVVGELSGAVDHFVKVSRSYWGGLFGCYDTAGLPRTNNDLERAFGSHRYHERRATGRKGASPSLVLRGAAKLVAGLATRHREVTAAELAGADRVAWKRLRAELETRRERRTERRRFRRDPEGYLKALENKLIQLRLPA